jgi:hypothetical protein
MGIRGELFSTRVTCNGRTYFFNVKENRTGDMFLTVVESKPTETEGFERRSVVVFAEDMSEFVKAFQGALSFMEKPEAPKKTVAFSPSKGPEKKARPHGGFAGSEAEEKAAAAPVAKKRRIVVRRKPESPQDPS